METRRQNNNMEHFFNTMPGSIVMAKVNAKYCKLSMSIWGM